MESIFVSFEEPVSRLLISLRSLSAQGLASRRALCVLSAITTVWEGIAQKRLFSEKKKYSLMILIISIVIYKRLIKN